MECTLLMDTTIEESNLTLCVFVQTHDSFQGDLKDDMINE